MSARKHKSEIQGFINLNKPTGLNSRRADDLVARCFGRTKTGHAGTLDPMAEGVLPVAVGSATRLLNMISGSQKEYLALIKFGFATDTYDATGQAVKAPNSESQIRDVLDDLATAAGRERLEEVLNSFRGEIMQRPPAYSALKRGGRAAHRMARNGEQVQLEARPACYYQIEMLELDLPVMRLRLKVSSGTYIRSLAHDLGEKLGCGAHLAELVRTCAGAFKLSDSIALADLQKLASEGRAAEVLLPCSKTFPELPCFAVTGRQELYDVAHGRPVLLKSLSSSGPKAQVGQECLIAEGSGRIIGLGEIVKDGEGRLGLHPRRKIR
jgi:tRNA pseudouridine55 synthase